MLSSCNKYSIFMDRSLLCHLFILFFCLLLNKIYEYNSILRKSINIMELVCAFFNLINGFRIIVI